MLEKLHISNSEVLGVKEGNFYFSHNGVRNKCSAFYENETSHLELHIPRLLGVDVVCLELKHEDGTAISKNEVPFINAAGEFDVYQASFNLPVGLYFFTVTVKRKLRNHQRFSANVQKGKIHLLVFVFKNTKPCDLGTQKIGIITGITCGTSDKDHHSF